MNSKIKCSNTNSKCQKHKLKIEHWHIIAFYLALYDIIAVNMSYFFALLLRFDIEYSSIPKEYLSAFISFMPYYTVFVLISFYLLKLYKSLWRFASFSELNRIFLSSIVTTAFHVIAITLMIRRMPISYYVFGAIIQLCLVTGVRFAYRYISMQRIRHEKNKAAVQNVMVIGAGAAGQMILKELNGSPCMPSRACCVIDDNPNKWGRLMEGVPVEGGRDAIMNAVEKYDINIE